jgi:hypothetical protein
MKKTISILLALAILSTLSLTAVAKGPTPEERNARLEQVQKQIEAKKVQAEQKFEERTAQLEQKKHQFQTKKEEFDALRNTLKTKRDEVLKNRLANIDLLKKNNQLREQIKLAIEKIKADGGELTEAQTKQIEALNLQAKEIILVLKDTKGDISALGQANRMNIAKKDYVIMEQAFSDIYNVQKVRNENLLKLNGILIQILKVVSQ